MSLIHFDLCFKNASKVIKINIGHAKFQVLFLNIYIIQCSSIVILLHTIGFTINTFPQARLKILYVALDKNNIKTKEFHTKIDLTLYTNVTSYRL